MNLDVASQEVVVDLDFSWSVAIEAMVSPVLFQAKPGFIP